MSDNKHSAYDLAQMQALPLEAKIKMTKQRIKEWYEYFNGNVYVGFSGGKDSTVLKHIIDSMYDVPALFINTGLEYPELQKFVKDIQIGKYSCFKSNVIIIRPEKRFDEVIKEYGYPVISKTISHNIAIARNNPDGNVAMNIVFNKNRSGLFNQYKWRYLVDAPFKISDKCCNIMKKNPAHKYEKDTGRKAILGTMANESKIRYAQWLKNGCNSFTGKTKQTSQPLSFWTENDILMYIKKYNVPYASVYGDIIETGKKIKTVTGEVSELKTTGCNRTGCMFCAYGCHLEKENEARFLKMKQTHPVQYNYCMKPVEEGGLGLKNVIEWINENLDTNIKY